MIALAQHLRRSPYGLGRSVLLLIALTTALIVGLLEMHALNAPCSPWRACLPCSSCRSSSSCPARASPGLPGSVGPGLAFSSAGLRSAGHRLFSFSASVVRDDCALARRSAEHRRAIG
jgi:hypothetical protein